MGRSVVVQVIPPCQLNPDHGPAYADARLPVIGSWAYVCRLCFAAYQCSLGTGHGQELIGELRTDE
jgi:hypothetical protein